MAVRSYEMASQSAIDHTQEILDTLRMRRDTNDEAWRGSERTLAREIERLERYIANPIVTNYHYSAAEHEDMAWQDWDLNS